LLTAFRSSSEECQLLIKSEALRDSIAGNFVALLTPDISALTDGCHSLELSESLWTDMVQVEVNGDKQYIKVWLLLFLCVNI
jgi:hypothetical protein